MSRHLGGYPPAKQVKDDKVKAVHEAATVKSRAQPFLPAKSPSMSHQIVATKFVLAQGLSGIPHFTRELPPVDEVGNRRFTVENDFPIRTLGRTQERTKLDLLVKG